MSKPGIILKRPVGSNGPFGEHAELPHLSGDELDDGLGKPRRKPRTQPAPKIDDKEARGAASEFEKSQKQRESERRKEEAARVKER
jgi:colicin import membrane protein